MLEILAGLVGLLSALSTRRFLLCFVVSAGVAIWILFGLDAPWAQIGSVAAFLIGVIVGARWQSRYEARLRERKA